VVGDVAHEHHAAAAARGGGGHGDRSDVGRSIRS
jgi:hypothetical protein